MASVKGWKALIVAVAVATVAACGGDSPAPSPTATPPPTTVTEAPTATATATPSPRAIATPSPTPAATATATPEATPTPTVTPTATPEPNPTATATPTPAAGEPAPASARPQLPPTPVFDTPPGVYTDITVGTEHACALTEDGEAVCWGVERGDAWDTPPGTYTFIEAEGDTTCAITDEGVVVCWATGGAPIAEGEPDPSRDSPPGRYKAVSWDAGYVGGLAPSGHYTCALTVAGSVVCWGLEGSDSDKALFPPDPPSGSYTAIRVDHDSPGHGARHLTACALADAGDVVCWGSGHGHLSPFGPYTYRYSGDHALVGDVFCDRTGDGEPAFREREWCDLSIGDDGAPYVAISPGEQHTCAITAGGMAMCEAERHSLSYEIGGTLALLTPPDHAPDRYVAIDTGESSWASSGHFPVVYACALTEAGGVVCWKSVPNKFDRPDPDTGRYVAVSDGLGHTCALTGQGEAVCWGWNNFGQAQAPPDRYTAVSAGHGSTWALTEEGEAVRWGGDFPSGGPPPVTGRYIDVSAGDFNGACALTAHGEAVCWPEGAELPQGPFESISLGWGGHGCALMESGKVVCFSRSWARHSGACGASYGEAGCWGRWLRDEPGHEPPPGPFRMVSVAQFHACGVTLKGRVVCWDERRGWVADVPDDAYVAVSTGLYHDCALTSTGEAHCWGEFGNAKSGTDYGPVDPPPGRYTAITSGHHRACALTEAGEVVCWGDTDYEERPNFYRPYEE